MGPHVLCCLCFVSTCALLTIVLIYDLLTDPFWHHVLIGSCVLWFLTKSKLCFHGALSALITGVKQCTWISTNGANNVCYMAGLTWLVHVTLYHYSTRFVSCTELHVHVHVHVISVIETRQSKEQGNCNEFELWVSDMAPMLASHEWAWGCSQIECMVFVYSICCLHSRFPYCVT